MSYHSIQSFNFADHYVRHQNFMGQLSTMVNYQDRLDASFWVQPGLASSDGVTFQAVNFQHHYLRHQLERVHLSHLGVFETDDLLAKDATFMPRPGLADAAAVSYESFNYPGRYLRHRDFAFWVEADDGGETFKLDSTFRLVAPFETGPHITVVTEKTQDGGYVTVSGTGWTTGEPLTILVYGAPGLPSPYEMTHVDADDRGKFEYTELVRCIGTSDPAVASAEVQVWCTNGRGVFDAKSVKAKEAWVCLDAGIPG